MKRSRLSTNGKKKQKKRLVSISVAREWKKLDKQAVHEGFKKPVPKSGFYEADVPVSPVAFKGLGYVPFVQIQISGSNYSRFMKDLEEYYPDITKRLQAGDQDSMESHDEHMRNWLKSNVTPADIIEVYIDTDDVSAWKQAFPQMRVKTHYNSLFTWIHKDNWSEVLGLVMNNG